MMWQSYSLTEEGPKVKNQDGGVGGNGATILDNWFCYD